MAVDVFQSNKKKEDQLDRVVKLTSIGASVAGIASKAGGSGVEEDGSRMQADNPVGNDALTRRLNKLKTSYA